MNNHWHTNYRADQDGPTWFRYAIRPHGAYDPAAATRFGIETTEPLLIAPPITYGPLPSILSLEPADVIATALKPSDDGKATIVRLYNPTDKTQTAHLKWFRPVRATWLSSGLEEQGAKAPEAIAIPKSGMVTLRVDQ
jgi:alpha-mannosidase